MKKISLFIASTAAITMAACASGLAAELPSYEVSGLPISAAQVQVLGAANVQEQSSAPASTATPLQLSVLTPRAKTTTTVGRAIR